MPAISFAACVLSRLVHRSSGDTGVPLYLGLFTIQEENLHRFNSAQTQTWQLIVLVRRSHVEHTYNPISGLTVVAHWPVEEPRPTLSQPQEADAKGRAAL